MKLVLYRCTNFERLALERDGSLQRDRFVQFSKLTVTNHAGINSEKPSRKEFSLILI